MITLKGKWDFSILELVYIFTYYFGFIYSVVGSVSLNSVFFCWMFSYLIYAIQVFGIRSRGVIEVEEAGDVGCFSLIIISNMALPVIWIIVFIIGRNIDDSDHSMYRNLFIFLCFVAVVSILVGRRKLELVDVSNDFSHRLHLFILSLFFRILILLLLSAISILNLDFSMFMNEEIFGVMVPVGFPVTMFLFIMLFMGESVGFSNKIKKA